MSYKEKDKEDIEIEMRAFEDTEPEIIKCEIEIGVESDNKSGSLSPSNEKQEDEYGEKYYKEYKWGVPKWENHNARIADYLYNKYHPVKVLDVGCGTGVLISQLRDRGIDAWGFDNSQYAINNVKKEHKAWFFKADMRDYKFSHKNHWDMILMIEIMEHISLEEAKEIIKKACAITNRIIFSSDPEFPDDRCPSHQFGLSIEEWDKIFEGNEFCRGDKIGCICPWAYEYKRGIK